MSRRAANEGAASDVLDMMREIGQLAEEGRQGRAQRTRQLRVDLDVYDHELLEAAARDARRMSLAGASKRLMVQHAIRSTFGDKYRREALAVLRAKNGE